jgi:hypothetical protein
MDARRLKLGTFHYRDLEAGKQVGTGSITIQRIPESGNYRFSNVATFSSGFSGFQSQRWQAIATPGLRPLFASLEFGGESRTSPVFELRYHSGRVGGFVVEHQGSQPTVKRPIDDPVPCDTVDQRIDWAAVISGALVPGQHMDFNVYDPGTGVSAVVVTVGSVEMVKTPGGDFAAIRVAYEVTKRGKAERYIVFASQSLPRFMVREEFPNGVITELVR